MNTSRAVQAAHLLGKCLLALSLLSVLVWWRASAALFLTGCLSYASIWLLHGHLPHWAAQQYDSLGTEATTS